MMSKVLLCDDEIHVRSILARRFQSAGWEVVTADNGKLGVEAAREHAPDIIVIDYNMPVMNGGDAAVALREDPATAHIPIIMLSGQSHMMDEQTRSQTNIVNIVPKPFSAMQVIKAVQDALEGDASGEAAA